VHQIKTPQSGELSSGVLSNATKNTTMGPTIAKLYGMITKQKIKQNT